MFILYYIVLYYTILYYIIILLYVAAGTGGWGGDFGLLDAHDLAVALRSPAQQG